MRDSLIKNETMLNIPLVSVIIATYRRDDSLKLAVNSVIHQSYPNVEILIIDDNANEEWNIKIEKIVTEFAENGNIVYIQNKENLGSAKTRNVGIDSANGKYITFLDDDDIYLTEKIERQVQFMIDGDFDYSITDLNLYNENGRLIDKRKRTFIKDTTYSALKNYHLKYHLTGTDTMMFKKSYLIQIGGFANIDVGDEYYLIQRAIEGRGSFGYLPRCDIMAYVHSGEAGLSSGEGKIDGENILYEYKKQYFNDIDIKTKQYIKMRHYAVIAFAEIRRRRVMAFVLNAIKSFVCAPISCMKLFLFGN